MNHTRLARRCTCRPRLSRSTYSTRSIAAALISPEEVQAFERDGAVVVRGVFDNKWLDLAAAGIERNLAEPGVYASENDTQEGRFFDDYCNWHRIPEFQSIVRESPAAELAALAMQSKTAQFFHDHVLVKEPHTVTLRQISTV